MLISTHTKGAPQSFSIQSEQTPDGNYRAYCKTYPEIGEVTSDSRSSAIARMSDRLERFNDNGLQLPDPISLNADSNG